MDLVSVAVFNGRALPLVGSGIAAIDELEVVPFQVEADHRWPDFTANSEW